MILNANNSKYSFNFTKNFIPDEVANHYIKYLHKVPGLPIKKPIDFINYGIQGINLPGLSFDFIEQVGQLGLTRKHRTSKHDQELMSKELNIEFQTFDAYVNYWMMYETLRYYYNFNNTEKYIPDQRLEILDSEDNIVVVINLSRILFTSISDIDLNFSANAADFKTFTCNFVYNQLDIKFEFDSVY